MNDTLAGIIETKRTEHGGAFSCHQWWVQKQILTREKFLEDWIDISTYFNIKNPQKSAHGSLDCSQPQLFT
jgi:hypothetical protein